MSLFIVYMIFFSKVTQWKTKTISVSITPCSSRVIVLMIHLYCRLWFILSVSDFKHWRSHSCMGSGVLGCDIGCSCVGDGSRTSLFLFLCSFFSPSLPPPAVQSCSSISWGCCWSVIYLCSVALKTHHHTHFRPPLPPAVCHPEC